MTKKLLVAFLLVFCVSIQTAKTNQHVLKQLATNLHGGLELHTIGGVTSYGGLVGTGYQFYFYKDKAYVKPEFDLKFAQYRYEHDYHVNAGSIAIPVTVGYNLLQTKPLGITLFAGIRYEQFLYTANNNYPYDTNNSQFGLTPGLSFRFFNKVSINASYYYGLTSLYKDGSGKISSFNFSFNF